MNKGHENEKKDDVATVSFSFPHDTTTMVQASYFSRVFPISDAKILMPIFETPTPLVASISLNQWVTTVVKASLVIFMECTS